MVVCSHFLYLFVFIYSCDFLTEQYMNKMDYERRYVAQVKVRKMLDGPCFNFNWLARSLYRPRLGVIVSQSVKHAQIH